MKKPNMKKKTICEHAKEYWETYNDFDFNIDVGFIMKDGKIMEMIPNNNNSKYTHEAVSKAWLDDLDKRTPENVNKGMRDFMKECGAIRFSIHWQDGEHADVLFETTHHKPTVHQIKTIVNDIRGMEKVEFYALLVSPHHSPQYCEYKSENPRPLDVQRWISKCWGKPE
ncbi:MAG: hypothetical protein NT038_09200 [Euryarchaeota archaeon]|nr:hypothetical protein [Euryarchaeota archaeon]